MKKFLSVSLLALVSIVSAQSPQSFSYQSVVRDANNDLVTNQAIGVQISILKNSPTGTVLYAERHDVLSNANGLITLNVGEGIVLGGAFSSISWGGYSALFIKSELDLTGGASYTISGTSQMLSVPYALYAENAGNQSDDQTLSLSGNTLSILDGNSITLPTSLAVQTIEGTHVGWRITGSDSANYGTIGDSAIDLSYSIEPSSTNGATGKTSFAVGYNAQASGNLSIAMGAISQASGTSSLALGYSTTSQGDASTAMGLATDASGAGATAMGNSTNASGDGSTAMGNQTTASGQVSTAFGDGTNASGNGSVAMGLHTIASGYGSTAMGGNTGAYSLYETTIGRFNTDYIPLGPAAWHGSDRLFVIGNGTDFNSRSNALTIFKDGKMNINDAYDMPTADGSAGQKLTTDGAGMTYWSNDSVGTGLEIITEGGNTGRRLSGADTLNYGNIGHGAVDLSSSNTVSSTKGATGYNSTAMGSNTTASGYTSTAMGSETNASGYASTAMGDYSSASGFSSVAMGSGTNASGKQSIAMGDQTNASGANSTAMGWLSTASGAASTVIGDNSNASGDGSIAMGSQSSAAGLNSVAIGVSDTASGDYSTSLGVNSQAIGEYSKAIGSHSKAIGRYSTAIGTTSEALGDHSTTLGYVTFALGDRSTAMGSYTVAPSVNETAIGVLNTPYTPHSTTSWVATDRLFSIGNGKYGVASNALTIYKDGKMNINDAYDMPTADGTAGQVLTTDGAGVASWVDAANGASGLEQITEGGNTGRRLTGSDTANHGNIGEGAIDLTYNMYQSSIAGATGMASIATGALTAASGTYSTAMGYQTYAQGAYSIAVGDRTTASGIMSTAMGGYTNASGFGSTAMGAFTVAPSLNETAIGLFNTDYIPSGTGTWYGSDRLFVIGNGTDTSNRSNALTIYKDGKMNINDAYDMPTADGTAGQVLTTDGTGVTSWVDAANGASGLEQITEGGNTGRRLTGSDTAHFGDIGKHAIDLSYSGSPSSNRGATGYYSIATGVNTTASAHSSMAMGHSTKASGTNSVAMGYLTDASASSSTAMGDRTTASGFNSTAMGSYTNASGAFSTVIGRSTDASGYSSTAMGNNTTASGTYSVAMGWETEASAISSTAMGERTTASGHGSAAMGGNTSAYSLYETTIGAFNTDYIPSGTGTWYGSDRLFVIGNGTDTSNRSNALTIYKDGKMNINDAYDMPTADGSAGQVLTTDGAGVTSWTTPLTSNAWNVSGANIYRSSGMVAVGTTVPNSTLHINAPNGSTVPILRAQHNNFSKFMVAANGNTALYFNTAPSYKLQLDVNSAAKPTSSSWTVASDARLKTNVSPFEDGLDVLMAIDPVWFNYNGKAGMPTDEKGVGTIAQELQKVAPYMVSKWTHTEGSLEENAPMTNSGKSKTTSFLGVDYGAMDFILINSIQEQQAIIQTQAEEIESQEQRIEKLEHLLDQLLNAEEE